MAAPRQRLYRRIAEPEPAAPSSLLTPEPGAGIICAHDKPIHQCGKCSKEGEQYELDRAVEEAAGGVSAEEWFTRASQFRAKAAQLRLTLGGRDPQTRAAQRAAREAGMIADALLQARQSRLPAGPRTPENLTPQGDTNGQ